MIIEQLDKTWITDMDYLLFYESICNNPYLARKPYPRQAWPIYQANKPNMNNQPNQLLVGAGGFGGKTVLGTMMALQYIGESDYSCLVTRKNYAELTGQDSIWDNAKNWATDPSLEYPCKVNESRLLIEHPNGGRIWFKAFDREDKKGKVKSESYNRIINDEASELHPDVLAFLFRSLRGPSDSNIPLAMINLSNPGGPSTAQLCERYVDGDYPYFPLDWRHNPYIDKETYSNTLDNLNVIDRQYQKEGDWHYIPSSGVLDNSWLRYWNPERMTYYDPDLDQHIPINLNDSVTYTGWDLAISVKQTADYTCSCTATFDNVTGNLFIRNWTREHIPIAEQKKRVISQQQQWNSTVIGIETVAYQEALVQLLAPYMLPIRKLKPQKDKVTRIASTFTAFERGQIYLPENHPLLSEFRNEYALFPDDSYHDDLLDATEMCISLASKGASPYTDGDDDNYYTFSDRRIAGDGHRRPRI